MKYSRFAPSGSHHPCVSARSPSRPSCKRNVARGWLPSPIVQAGLTHMTNVPARVERRLPVFIFAQPFWSVCTALTPAELIKLAPCKLRMLDDDGLFAWKSSCNTSFAVPVCASVPGETVLGNNGAPPAFSEVDPNSALSPVADPPPHPAIITESITANSVLITTVDFLLLMWTLCRVCAC